MNKKQILINQLTTDIQFLKEDIGKGLTDERGTLKALTSIQHKITELKRLEDGEVEEAEKTQAYMDTVEDQERKWGEERIEE